MSCWVCVLQHLVQYAYSKRSTCLHVQCLSSTHHGKSCLSWGRSITIRLWRTHHPYFANALQPFGNTCLATSARVNKRKSIVTIFLSHHLPQDFINGCTVFQIRLYSTSSLFSFMNNMNESSGFFTCMWCCDCCPLLVSVTVRAELLVSVITRYYNIPGLVCSDNRSPEDRAGEWERWVCIMESERDEWWYNGEWERWVVSDIMESERDE